MTFAPNQFQHMVENPEKVLAELDLIEFTKQAWHVLHPAQPFVYGWAVEAMAEHLQAVTDGQIKKLLINVPPGCTKGGLVTEPVLTTHGWKAHGALRPGDFVFGPDGQPRRVDAVTPHMVTPAWRVEFDDGAVVHTTTAHEWIVQRDEQKTPRKREPVRVETPDIRTGARPDSVLLAAPPDMPPQHLMIDPYLLGAWLGDGATLAGYIYATDADAHVILPYGEITNTQLPSESNTLTKPFHRIKIPGLQTKLRLMGLRGNKHIPQHYLHAATADRWELLRGLMDTDGTATKNGQCRYSSKLRHLSVQVLELACSLGIKASLHTKESKLNGKVYAPAHIVTFTPPGGAILFRLERKQARLKAKTNARSRQRYVKSIAQGGDAIMNCIQVEGGHYLIGKHLVPTSNSMLTCTMWPAWEWGPRRLPHHKFITASHEQGLAMNHQLRSRDLIMSDWYQARWPIAFKEDVNEKTLYANTATGWRRAVGVRGTLTGYRGDRVIIDDPHDVKGAESEVVREEAARWFFETVPTRYNDEKTFAQVVIMQRLHTRDISGRILASDTISGDWTQLILPMEYEEGRRCRTSVLWSRTGKPFEDPRTEDGELLWPERFPHDNVEQLKATFRTEGGTYAEAGQLQQRPVPRGGGDFKREDFNIIDERPQKGIIIRGWDLAGSKKRRSAWTVGVKLHQAPDGHLTILDVVRFKGTSHEVDVQMKKTADTDGKRVIIDIPQDPGSAGKAVVSHIVKNLEGFITRFSLESGEKDFRAQPFAAQVQAGNVSMLRRSWNDAYLSEAELFPAGDFKDQIDATSRAYAALLRSKPQGLPLIPPTLSKG